MSEDYQNNEVKPLELDPEYEIILAQEDGEPDYYLLDEDLFSLYEEENYNPFKLAKELLSFYNSIESDRLSYVKSLSNNLKELGFSVVNLKNLLSDESKLGLFLEDPKRGSLVSDAKVLYEAIRAIESSKSYKQLSKYHSLITEFEISDEEAYVQLVKLLSEKVNFDDSFIFDVYLHRLEFYGKAKNMIDDFSYLPDSPEVGVKDHYESLINSMLADEGVSIKDLIIEQKGRELPWKPTLYGFKVPNEFDDELVEAIYAQALQSVPVYGTNPDEDYFDIVAKEAQELVKAELGVS